MKGTTPTVPVDSEGYCKVVLTQQRFLILVTVREWLWGTSQLEPWVHTLPLRSSRHRKPRCTAPHPRRRRVGWIRRSWPSIKPHLIVTSLRVVWSLFVKPWAWTPRSTQAIWAALRGKSSPECPWAPSEATDRVEQ
eukprot:s3468_g7.t1